MTTICCGVIQSVESERNALFGNFRASSIKIIASNGNEYVLNDVRYTRKIKESLDDAKGTTIEIAVLINWILAIKNKDVLIQAYFPARLYLFLLALFFSAVAFLSTKYLPNGDDFVTKIASVPFLLLLGWISLILSAAISVFNSWSNDWRWLWNPVTHNDKGRFVVEGMALLFSSAALLFKVLLILTPSSVSGALAQLARDNNIPGQLGENPAQFVALALAIIGVWRLYYYYARGAMLSVMASYIPYALTLVQMNQPLAQLHLAFAIRLSLAHTGNTGFILDRRRAIEQCIQSITEASIKNIPEAQFYHGKMLERGNYVAVDKTRAAELIASAKKNGFDPPYIIWGYNILGQTSGCFVP